MVYGITLSLRQFLASYMPEVTEVVLMRDGVSISGKTKPFLTVQYLGSQDELLTAGRKGYEEIHRYQIGVHAADVAQMLRLESKVKTLLRRPDGIVRYTDEAIATEERFNVDVSGFTPITNEDSSNTTANHRGYFDASVTIYLDTGDTAFTQ
jgi:hypothetical protein